MGVAGSDYPGDYSVEFGVYRGGWLEAAQRYRHRTLQQKWVQAEKLSARTDFPEILKKRGCVGYRRLGVEWGGGHSATMDAPLLAIQKELEVPIALHWHNWHHLKFDNEYSHFLPPKPGFAERVKDLVSQGVLVMPYINGLSANFNIPDFANFGPHANVDEAGGYRMHHYSDSAGRLLSMCPTQEYWQNTISSLVQTLVEDYGVNAVYVDQIAAMEPELCFNRQHGHPLGGGLYWTDGNRELLTKVRNISGRQGRNPLITSEGTDEVFMDLVDGSLTWAQPTDREIPMMEVVYSGYAIFFASACDFKKSDEFFGYVHGQAFIDGRQNGWMDSSLFRPENSVKVEYLRQSARLRVATKRFLVYGRLWGPVLPENSIPTIRVDGFGSDRHAGTVPAAEARLWQDEDGHLAVFLANYGGGPVEFKYRIDPAKFGLSGRRYDITDIPPGGTIPISTATEAVERKETLGPRKVKVIEIAVRQRESVPPGSSR